MTWIDRRANHLVRKEKQSMGFANHLWFLVAIKFAHNYYCAIRGDLPLCLAGHCWL